ncbi:MAG: hypothetical protein DHS20C08_15900 [Rhodomicrobium sp.]|nr:MAG: hypothetical protein DHS20C08_15900 [Rhodomicrobium sp.]
MIRYQLKCKRKHEFDSWFRSSADFDEQQAEGLLSCPHCGSKSVEKALMAPNVSTSRRSAAAVDREFAQASVAASEASNEASAVINTEAASGSTAPPSPLTGSPASDAEVRQALRDMREKVTQNADYVGDRFASVARDMHYGDEPQRGIYGEAEQKEVRELVEEGINIMPLPSFPEDKN